MPPSAPESSEVERSTSGAQPASSTTNEQNYWDFCPNCSTPLQNMRCKFRCPKCHYFMSCSDFD